MIFRALDVNSDWTFGKGTENYLYGNAAIALNIKTRLLSFLNDCFFDMNAGLDWFTYLGTPNQSQQITLKVKAVILQSYGVVGVNNLTASINRSGRIISLQYNINTIYTTQYVENLQVANNG